MKLELQLYIQYRSSCNDYVYKKIHFDVYKSELER